MPKLITNKSVVAQNSEVTVHITLELVIKLDSDGLSIQAKTAGVDAEPVVKSVDKPKNSDKNFVLPHFVNSEKIDNII